MKDRQPPHALSCAETLCLLGTNSHKGLTSSGAQARLAWLGFDAMEHAACDLFLASLSHAPLI